MRNSISDIEYHLIKRKKGKNGKKVVYYIGILDELKGKNKHRKYKAVRSLDTGNKVLAQKRAAEKIEKGEFGSVKTGLKEFLLNFWDPEKSEYLRDKVTNKKPLSPVYIANCRALLETYVIPWFDIKGITQLSKLTRLQVLAWKNDLAETEGVSDKHPRKISSRTINAARQAFFEPLKWAFDNDEIPSYPGRGIKPIPDEPTEREIFEADELIKLFNIKWPDQRYKAACMLAADSGMRLGEIRGLLIKNVHLAKKELDVKTNWQDGQGIKGPKWGSYRDHIEISEPVVSAIREVLALHRWGADPDHFVFFGIESASVPIGKRALTNALAAAMKKAKLRDGRTFHSLRHSLCSHARGKVSEAALRKIFGWSEKSNMVKEYSHTTERDRKELRNIRKQIIPFKKIS